MNREKIGGEDLHDPLEWGQRGREGHVRRSAIECEEMRLGDWIRGKGERGEVSLSASLV